MTSGSAVVGYIRVSTDDQACSGAGLEAQRRAISDEVARRGWRLLRIEEDALSGRTLRRPGLERALAALKSGEAAGMVVAKLDRLTRSVADLGRTLERAQRERWNLVALDFGLDLSTPQGELVANVLVSVSQWERRIIGQRTREALAVKRSQGVRLGRPPSVAPAVRARIVDERRAGRSFGVIAARLEADGVPTSRGGRRWYASTVRAVVQSDTAIER